MDFLHGQNLKDVKRLENFQKSYFDFQRVKKFQGKGAPEFT